MYLKKCKLNLSENQSRKEYITKQGKNYIYRLFYYSKFSLIKQEG